MCKNNLTDDDKKILRQSKFFRRKNLKKVTALTIMLMTALIYSRWEIPTLLHGKEFNNAHILDKTSYETGSWLSSPKFIKIINYSDAKADVLWVMEFTGHDTHTWVEFVKKKSKSGKMEWTVDTWRECTPTNGTPRCFFPWYGGISVNY